MTALSIGDTVAFKSHPYGSTSAGKLITSEIIGEHLMTPPLMIVIEMLHHLQGNDDDKSENEILPKKSHSAKCLWYNSSIHQFEETWILQNELKKIPRDSDPIIVNSEEFKDWENFKNRLVSLNTLKKELGKQKRSVRKEGVTKKDQVTHYLEFVSPVMELIEIKEFEIKEAQLDPKNSQRKKEFPKFIAKCKWYNPKGNKYSERFLPLEALNLIPEIKAEIFNSISEFIECEYYVHIEKVSQEYLFKPTLLFKSGYYYLSGYNIINNKEESILVDNDLLIKPVENPFGETWPKFDDERKLIPIETFIDQNVEVGDYWRIKYENFHGEVTTRTITPKQINEEQSASGVENSTIYYLTADCHLRSAERHFRFDRVRSIQVIEFSKS